MTAQIINFNQYKAKILNSKHIKISHASLSEKNKTRYEQSVSKLITEANNFCLLAPIYKRQL